MLSESSVIGKSTFLPQMLLSIIHIPLHMISKWQQEPWSCVSEPWAENTDWKDSFTKYYVCTTILYAGLTLGRRALGGCLEKKRCSKGRPTLLPALWQHKLHCKQWHPFCWMLWCSLRPCRNVWGQKLLWPLKQRKPVIFQPGRQNSSRITRAKHNIWGRKSHKPITGEECCTGYW